MYIFTLLLYKKTLTKFSYHEYLTTPKSAMWRTLSTFKVWGCGDFCTNYGNLKTFQWAKKVIFHKIEPCKKLQKIEKKNFLEIFFIRVFSNSVHQAVQCTVQVHSWLIHKILSIQLSFFFLFQFLSSRLVLLKISTANLITYQ